MNGESIRSAKPGVLTPRDACTVIGWEETTYVDFIERSLTFPAEQQSTNY